jgi:hypothetical protein
MKAMNLGQALDDFILNNPGFAGTRREWFVALKKYVTEQSITPKNASEAFWTKSAVGSYVGRRIGKTLMVSAKEPGGTEIIGRKVDLLKTREKIVVAQAEEEAYNNAIIDGLKNEIDRLKGLLMEETRRMTSVLRRETELRIRYGAVVERQQIMARRYQELKDLVNPVIHNANAMLFVARLANNTVRKHYMEDQDNMTRGLDAGAQKIKIG